MANIAETLKKEFLKHKSNNMNFEQLSNDVLVWANEKGILKPENHKNQALKMVSEIGELCDAIIKDDKPEIIDGIGDALVTIIILAEQLGLNPVNCLQSAYNEIKDRTGKSEGGIFIKDTVKKEYKVGDVLTAIDHYVVDGIGLALRKDENYKIEAVKGDEIIIINDLDYEHFFAVNNLHEFFKV